MKVAIKDYTINEPCYFFENKLVFPESCTHDNVLTQFYEEDSDNGGISGYEYIECAICGVSLTNRNGNPINGYELQ